MVNSNIFMRPRIFPVDWHDANRYGDLKLEIHYITTDGDTQ